MPGDPVRSPADAAERPPAESTEDPAALAARAEDGDSVARSRLRALAMNWSADAALSIGRLLGRSLDGCERKDRGRVVVLRRNAARWLERAFANGSPEIRREAGYELGMLSGVSGSNDWREIRAFRDVPRALVWFRRAARAGDPFSAFMLAVAYRLGEGVPRDERKAGRWIDLTRKLAGEKAFRTRFLPQWNGFADHAKRWSETVDRARQAIVEAESEQSVDLAMGELRRLCGFGFAPAIAVWAAEILDTKQRNHYGEARTFLREAVRQGHPDALAVAGNVLLRGGPGVPQDIKRARGFLERAREKGSAVAWTLLGICAAEGLGEPPDEEKAKALFEKAGRLGNGGGWYCLAGHGASRETYRTLLRRAAELGEAYACYALGMFYGMGEGGPRNETEEKRWLGKAAFRKHPDASNDYARFVRGSAMELSLLERAASAGVCDAGIMLGQIRMGFGEDRFSGTLTDWREAERLFRKYCPLKPFSFEVDEVLAPFFAKPKSARTKRDRRFLKKARAYLLDRNPTKGAELFGREDPAFARKCRALAEERAKDSSASEKRGADLFSDIGKADADWLSGDDAARKRAGAFFVDRALVLSKLDEHEFDALCPSGSDSEKAAAFCFWRAVQSLLDRETLEKEDRLNIGFWSLYPSRLFAASGREAIPPFVLEAAVFAWKRGAEFGLSPRDRREACEFAADHGDRDALLRMAGRSPALWLGKAVDAKLPAALRMLADQILRRSESDDTERRRAEELIRKAAEGGDAEAQFRQGKLLFKTASSKEARTETAEWFRKAAEQGHPGAQLEFGWCRFYGFGVQRSRKAARKLVESVVERSKPESRIRRDAEYFLGRLLLENGDEERALPHLEAAAELGKFDAMKTLALDPRLDPVQSARKTADWCEKAIGSLPGNSEEGLRGRLLCRLASNRLVYLATDSNRAGTLARCAALFREAAEAGNAEGAYEWARCLLFGDGVEPDRAAAKEWFEKAAEKAGDPADDRHPDALARAWLESSLFD